LINTDTFVPFCSQYIVMTSKHFYQHFDCSMLKLSKKKVELHCDLHTRYRDTTRIHSAIYWNYK